jgi:hypothetical protein
MLTQRLQNSKTRNCLAGSKKLNHKDLEDLQEPASHRGHAPSVPPQGRSAARCNIFGRGPTLRKCKVTLVQCDDSKRYFLEVLEAFVVPFRAERLQRLKGPSSACIETCAVYKMPREGAFR